IIYWEDQTNPTKPKKRNSRLSSMIQNWNVGTVNCRKVKKRTFVVCDKYGRSSKRKRIRKTNTTNNIIVFVCDFIILDIKIHKINIIYVFIYFIKNKKINKIGYKIDKKLINEFILCLKKLSHKDPIINLPLIGEYHKLKADSSKYSFLIDINRKGRKGYLTLQLRNSNYQDKPLIRLDISGPAHKNPEGDLEADGQ